VKILLPKQLRWMEAMVRMLGAGARVL